MREALGAGPCPPPALLPAAGLAALILCTAWWQAMALVWGTGMAGTARADKGDDIPLPEALEQDHEHGLFA